MGVYANFDPQEGSVNGDKTVAMKRRTRRVIITNDSSTKNLFYKFNESETYGTLKPTETISMDIWARTVYLNSVGSVAYRVWGIG